MYEELVKRLRYCAISDNQCSECKYHGGSPDGSKMCLDVLMEDAADAIEELSKHYCPHMIRNVHDRGDDSLCRVLGAEPPKEEET